MSVRPRHTVLALKTFTVTDYRHYTIIIAAKKFNLKSRKIPARGIQQSSMHSIQLAREMGLRVDSRELQP